MAYSGEVMAGGAFLLKRLREMEKGTGLLIGFEGEVETNSGQTMKSFAVYLTGKNNADPF